MLNPFARPAETSLDTSQISEAADNERTRIRRIANLLGSGLKVSAFFDIREREAHWGKPPFFGGHVCHFSFNTIGSLLLFSEQIRRSQLGPSDLESALDADVIGGALQLLRPQLKPHRRRSKKSHHA